MAIFIILFISFILRLINLNQSLWLDEAINVWATKNFSFLGIITEYSKADFHPPGFSLILWGWTHIFGISEISVRMPSVIFGVLTVFIVFLIGKKLLNKELGLIAALLLSVNPLHIYYSQEARMYSFAAFAVTLNFLFFIKLIKEKKVNIIFYISSSLLVFISDYVAYFAFFSQLIIVFILKEKQIIKKWLFFILLSVPLFFIWWLPIFYEQLIIGQQTAIDIPKWSMIVGDFGIKPLALTYIKFIIGRISHTNPLIYAGFFIPVGLFIGILILKGFIWTGKLNKVILGAWLVISIISSWLVSIYIPIYSYFRVIFTLPAFIFLISLGVFSFRSKIKYILLTVCVTVSFTCSLVYLTNHIFQREDWKGLVTFLKSLHADNSKILFESNGSFLPFDYYAYNLKGVGALANFPAKDELDVIDLKKTLNDSTDVYLINYLVDISDPNRLVDKELNNLGYKIVETKNFNGVGFVFHYQRKL